MTPEQRERYSRHILLPTIGEAGQQRLVDSHVLIIGAGGLGSPAAMYLASSGIGRITVADFDHVDLSNLQRQLLHRSEDIGRDKVDSARRTLNALNPEVEVTPLNWAPDDDELAERVAAADVVVDACDNFETRFALNRCCFSSGTPLVSAAAVRFEGQLSVFDPRREDSPCYRCLYDDASAEGEACSQVGVLAPLLGIIGSVQATETIKLLTGAGDTMVGRVLMLDALTMDWRVLKLRRDPHCPVCAERPRTSDTTGADTATV